MQKEFKTIQDLHSHQLGKGYILHGVPTVWDKLILQIVCRIKQKNNLIGNRLIFESQLM